MKTLYLTALVVVAGLAILPAARGQTWVEETYEDFADGELDASGQNLYVSRDGKVRTIHRFDLNQDGYVDLIFNSTHDTSTFVPATLGTVSRERRVGSEPLPIEGSTRAVLDDFNRDGWLDLAFCPNDSGLQHPRRFLTILYGGEDGWSSRRSNGMLPVHRATDLAVVDLNGDGWPDLATLNGEAWRPGQPEGRIIRVYWGDEHGYLLGRRQDLGVTGAIALAAGDFDGDGHADLAVLADKGRVHLLWAKPGLSEQQDVERSELSLPGHAARCLTAADYDGDGRVDLIAGTSEDALYVVPGGRGREWKEAISIPAFPASHVDVADVDGDGRKDVILCFFDLARAAGGEAAGAAGVAEAVRILWADEDGFSRHRLSELAAPYAMAAAAGDLDGDGRPDVVVAVHQSSEQFATESVIFYGSGDRRFEKSGRGFETEGASHVLVAPPEGPLPARAVFANSLGGTVGERVPLQVYWGGAGGFDPDRRTDIPFRSGYEATSADFNVDGFVDLLVVNSQHSGPAALDDPTAGANIFWGGRDGFDFEGERTVLRETFLGTSHTADLNRDGWLDIVLGIFDPIEPEGPTPVVIYYGSQDGFHSENRVAIDSDGRSIGSLIADFDRNGWLDIAVCSTYQDRIRIFWGGSGGFNSQHQSRLDIPFAIDLETADLNGDGYLDLIAGSYYDAESGHHDMGTLIFWGRKDGFREWDAQRLPGWAPMGHCVADFDGDGFLDLFAPHYLAELTRESIPSYLFWGGPDGFSARNRTNIIVDSADDALAGDFDGDGRLDLAIACHSRDGSHHTDSLVLYNDGKRFTEPRIQRLPTHGPHWMWAQDMGHIYNRQWRQTYTSSVLDMNGERAGGELAYRAEEPEGTRLIFSVRSAPDEKALAEQPWRTLRDDQFTLNRGDRRLQYQAEFRSDNGDRYPVLDRVSITLR